MGAMSPGQIVNGKMLVADSSEGRDLSLNEDDFCLSTLIQLTTVRRLQ